VDRNLATRWSANGDGQWLQLDLGATLTVGFVNVAFFAGDTRTAMFEIQVSPGGGVWSTVLSGTSSGTTTGLETLDFDDVSARFVRYLGHGNSVSAWNSLTEIQVFARATQLQGRRGALYTPPPNGFIVSPSGGEAVVAVNDTSGSIASVQAALDSARSAHPNATIVVTLQAGATYVVGSTGLVLGSRTCLLANGATIRAASSSATAAFLIQIAAGATNVSVAGGTLDGGGAALNGIVAPRASRVNVDRVTVRNTGREGILLKGNGSMVFDSEMTVTRCDTSATPSAGIGIQAATQALVIDNTSHDNGIGIRLATSARSSIVNNTCSGNTTGIEAGGNDNVVANNSCTGNGTGIDAVGTNNVVVSNLLGNNTTGIRSAGSNSTFVDNLFTAGNGTRLASSGTGNNIVPYKGALSAAGQNYFYPPLVSDPHNVTIVNGRGRFDLTIGGASLASVQSQYDAARSAHPNDVIVLHLNGSFTGTGLTLFSNTAVLLSGTLSGSGKVIAATNQSNISISGGTIDGGNTTGRNAMHFSGCRMVQVDGMTIRNFGARQPRRGGSDAVRFAGGSTPYIFTRNRMNNAAARGVWSQLSGAKAIYTDNDISNVNMDAIDLDSHTNAAVVKFNTLHDNIRAGIFIEEGARWNQAFGNVTTGNIGTDPGHADGGNGLWVWANGTGPTTQNTYFCNRSENNKRNLFCGTFDEITTQSTSNNFLFNNLLRNGTNGLVSQANGTQNYYSQNIVTGNATNYGSLESAVFFNSRDVP
jgi:parallel beta-helix repeat protein